MANQSMGTAPAGQSGTGAFERTDWASTLTCILPEAVSRYACLRRPNSARVSRGLDL